ncbi:MAG: RNA 2',3'-cyclic phosphodiesterase [Oleiphilaceae bacterium]|nr:RNA 2',3'-cyclic phosphodiesterase [Oleiphilaceae bacterium]
MRLFFALPVAGNLALNIDNWRQQQLAALPRPVAPQNYHLTLSFLGEVSHQQSQRLCEAMDTLLLKPYARPGELHLNTFGIWPKPGIAWIGPDQWPDALTALHKSLTQLGGSLGKAHNKNRFQPHVTLSRRCDTPIANLQQPDFWLPYSEIVLYESVQGREGVHYHPCESWPLTATARDQKPRKRPGLGTKS